MQKRTLLATCLIGIVLQLPAVAQQESGSASPPSGQAGFPESGIPVLFTDGSISSRFAGEAMDSTWSAATEALIRSEISKETWPELVRTDVQCRTSVCAVLFVFGSSQYNRRIDNIVRALRKGGGFGDVEKSQETVPVPAAISGYAEVLLHRTIRVPATRSAQWLRSSPGN